jgi:hypothetical protein
MITFHRLPSTSENSEYKTVKGLVKMLLYAKSLAVTTGRPVFTYSLRCTLVSKLKTSDSVEIKFKGKPQCMLGIRCDSFAERQLISLSWSVVSTWREILPRVYFQRSCTFNSVLLILKTDDVTVRAKVMNCLLLT